jgi:hypothetical protein
MKNVHLANSNDCTNDHWASYVQLAAWQADWSQMDTSSEVISRLKALTAEMLGPPFGSCDILKVEKHYFN